MADLSTLEPQQLAPTIQPSQPSDWLREFADRPWACRVLLLVWCGILFFYGINGGELWRTESLRAIIAQEFLNTGNWIVPTLYGEPLFTKPPGMYAAIALCSWPFGGVTDWSARLPSALAAACAVFLFSWYFRRQLGNLAGLIAGLVLPMSLLWLDKATTAEIDMVQVFWVTSSILFFLRALEEYPAPDSPNLATAWTAEKHSAVAALRVTEKGNVVEEQLPVSASVECYTASERWVWWGLALLCVVGGTLTKWTGPAFFYLTAITLLWRRGQLRLLFQRHHLVCAFVAGALCVGWAAWAVALTGWDEFYSTVFREASQRLSAHYSPRPYSWSGVFLHPFVVLAAALPGSLAAVFALWPGFGRMWNERERRLLQALNCWLWPNLLLWSFMTEHASRHSFPMLPALAGMTAMVWVAWLSGRLAWRFPWLTPRVVLICSLVVWLGFKIAFVHAITPQRNAHREPRAKGQLLARLIPSDAILYLFQLKDEGIMFYYGRPVRRLPSAADLPASEQDLYVILEEAEWTSWSVGRPAEIVERLTDEQREPIMLVRVHGSQR